MNLLVLTPRFPYPPTRGDAVRAWAEVAYLAARHRVWLACVDIRRPVADALAFVQERCADVAVAVTPAPLALARGACRLLMGGTITEGYFDSGYLWRTLAAWCRDVRFDAVLTFSSAMAPHALRVPATRRVLDMNDVDSRKYAAYAARGGWRSWVYRVEAARLWQREVAWSRGHDLTVLVNARERAKLIAALPAPATAVMRTCADFAARGDGPAESTTDLPREPLVTFIGSLFYPPNVAAAEWFTRHAWPQVRRACPTARCVLAGSRPTRRARRLARAPGVTVAADVPDIGAVLRAARVVVNPVHGDLGVQTKTIMALAAGRPQVVTSDVAGGLDFRVSPFLIANDPTSFASAVIRLLRDDHLAAELSRRASTTAAEFYDPATELAKLERWLTGTVADAAPPPVAPPLDVLRRTPSVAPRAPALETAPA